MTSFHKKKQSTSQNQSSFNANQNQNQRGHSQSLSRQEQSQSNWKMSLLAKSQCCGCGRDHNQDKSECPAFGKTYHKCGRINHFVNVCGRIPYRRPFRSILQGRQTAVNELNQNNHDSGASLTSIPNNSRGDSCNITVPKQVLDVVNLANNGNSSGKNFQHHLELDTLSILTCPATPVKSQTQPTQVFSNTEIDGVLIHGKQDTGAQINAMPLNVYDQLNQKLNGNLELKPCGDIKVIGYSKQSVQIVGKISVTCTHTNVIKKVNFYVTDIVDTKVILRLQFCRAFNLVQINCNDQRICKQIAVDIINSEFPRGLDPGDSTKVKAKLPPIDNNL